MRAPAFRLGRSDPGVAFVRGVDITMGFLSQYRSVLRMSGPARRRQAGDRRALPASPGPPRHDAWRRHGSTQSRAVYTYIHACMFLERASTITPHGPPN